jgi:hypothetical protein
MTCLPEASTSSPDPVGVRRTLLALLIFGISFGYVEAAVVVYLRALYEPLHEQFHPGHRTGDLFPLLTLEQLQASGPEPARWLAVELAREAATLLMLAAVALATARNFRQWLASFAIAFGVWDIFFYLSLKVMLQWPESPMTWDLLFLLPLPWAGPVLAPVVVALTLIAGGVLTWTREAAGRPLRPSWFDWTNIVTGGVVLVVAFCWDYRNLLAGGAPGPFNWPLFVLGEGLGLLGLVNALRTARQSAMPRSRRSPVACRSG